MIHKICLVVPSLKAGGMERVMSEVANYLVTDEKLEVHIILFSNEKSFFPISSSVKIHRPSPRYFKSIFSVWYLSLFLRKKIRELQPYSVLSFGSKYNSFVLLCTLGLKTNIYLSDRSNPYRNTKLIFDKNLTERHDGILHYILKKVFYKRAAGILVQTRKAKEIESEFSNHNNIILFPNPVRDIKRLPVYKKEKWIINVGRFIKTKNQLFLIREFDKIKYADWKLVFAGEGPTLKKAKELVEQLGLTDSVLFLGNVKDIDYYLKKSEIFAFSSVSEGFPNALAEGMKASLACISFDCVAGPSDLIDNGQNGFLIPLNRKNLFRQKLKELMNNETLRNRFQQNAKKSLQKFDRKLILNNLKEELIR